MVLYPHQNVDTLNFVLGLLVAQLKFMVKARKWYTGGQSWPILVVSLAHDRVHLFSLCGSFLAEVVPARNVWPSEPKYLLSDFP